MGCADEGGEISNNFVDSGVSTVPFVKFSATVHGDCLFIERRCDF